MKNLVVKYGMMFAAVITAVSVARAEPAIFTRGEMTIPEGVIISPDGNAYYTDISLAYDGKGALLIAGAKANSLVMVDNVDVLVMESFPLQVSLSVSGNLSVPCVHLLSPAVAFSNNHFSVVLAESNLGPAESCIAVLEPFETSVPLDVKDLPAGTYSVDVNGVETDFTFDMDNSPLN